MSWLVLVGIDKSSKVKYNDCLTREENGIKRNVSVGGRPNDVR